MHLSCLIGVSLYPSLPNVFVTLRRVERLFRVVSNLILEKKKKKNVKDISRVTVVHVSDG